MLRPQSWVLSLSGMLLLMVCFFLVGSVVLFSYVSLGGECLVRDVLSRSF